jgi:hypothetical protein
LTRKPFWPGRFNSTSFEFVSEWRIRTEIQAAYALPVFVWNMPIRQGSLDFFLRLLRKFIISIDVLHVTTRFLLDVGDLSRRDTSPMAPLMYFSYYIERKWDGANAYLLNLPQRYVIATWIRTQLCDDSHTCHDWCSWMVTMTPMRSSPFWILTPASLHSLFWQPARPCLAISGAKHVSRVFP